MKLLKRNRPVAAMLAAVGLMTMPVFAHKLGVLSDEAERLMAMESLESHQYRRLIVLERLGIVHESWSLYAGGGGCHAPGATAPAPASAPSAAAIGRTGARINDDDGEALNMPDSAISARIQRLRARLRREQMRITGQGCFT